jgi:hypothetical protein
MYFSLELAASTVSSISHQLEKTVSKTDAMFDSVCSRLSVSTESWYALSSTHQRSVSNR